MAEGTESPRKRRVVAPPAIVKDSETTSNENEAFEESKLPPTQALRVQNKRQEDYLKGVIETLQEELRAEREARTSAEVERRAEVSELGRARQANRNLVHFGAASGLLIGIGGAAISYFPKEQPYHHIAWGAVIVGALLQVLSAGINRAQS